MKSKPQFIYWFNQIDNDDVALVGGKNASLGEMYQALSIHDLPVPNGYAVSAEAYRYVIDQAGIKPQLVDLLSNFDADDTAELARRGRQCRELVHNAGIPADLRDEILQAFAQLQKEYGPDLTVAVRSSATAEDLPTASFAGQHESFLNVSGGEALIDACRQCFASLFTDRAIRYRLDQGFDHFDIALSIGIMKMVRSDMAASGVMFTLDTETGFRDVVYITSAYGLGENIVQGAVDPDEFYVHKPTFEQGYRYVLRRSLGEKKVKMVYGRRRGGSTIHNVVTPRTLRSHFSITDQDVLKLAEYAIAIETHYSEAADKPRPMDIEWAKDGYDGRLYIVQARPETVASQANGNLLIEYVLGDRSEILCKGRAVGGSVAYGKVRIIEHLDELKDFEAGDILVADITTPDWGAVMKQASALVTNRGGRTCHAAIVARELGIPAVVGCQNATEVLKNGETATISCAEGETGYVYRGELSFEQKKTNLSGPQRPKTKIMVNLGNPELAFRTAMFPTDGVGLARIEFIINESIKLHPMALLHPERVTDRKARETIKKMTRDYSEPADFFIEKLSEGVATIAAAFYPKPVVVRLSNFKSNEYASLIGGADFEPVESNPMIGFHGASRYNHPAYAEGFALECAALKRVRNEMGFSNVKLMVPFCRTINEAKGVLKAMSEHGLTQGDNGLEVYVMCEIPNNVMLIDEFSKYFDGFSIGSNDLAQLTLGVDRDSELVAFDFDERDPGVLEMLRLAVSGAKRNKEYCGICGQAPSDYPEIAEFLVRAGIDSLSLSPDSVLTTTALVAKLEASIKRN